MVLKIRTDGVEGHWIFYGDVRACHVSRDFRDTLLKLDYDAAWTTISPEGNPTVLLCIVRFKDGKESAIVCDEAYLLNDDGKTIERL